MANKTPNHNLNLYDEGDENWTHTPDMETIEERLIVRDVEGDRDDYTPYPDALFFARDSETWYVGDGSSWNQIGNPDGDVLSTEGIDATRQHVGPFPQDDYHEDDDEMWGVHFAADADLSIISTVVDFDADNSDSPDVDISLYEAQTTNSGENNQPQSVVPDGITESEALVDSISTTLSDGPQRVTLDFQTPSSPETGEFYLGVGSSRAGDTIYMRRIRNDGDGWDGWDDYTFDHIDLQFGSRWNNTTTSDSSENYYRVFDIEIGDAETRVTSPWSHDVEEIYMRPRDPEEEFDDVSPRSLWIDTS